jgi:hypothetical protein
MTLNLTQKTAVKECIEREIAALKKAVMDEPEDSPLWIKEWRLHRIETLKSVLDELN